MSTWGILGIICLVPLFMGGLVLLLDYIVEKDWIRRGRPTINDYIREIVRDELQKNQIKHKF
jgi:hypothetical protein